jgi:hypothetical protein
VQNHYIRVANRSYENVASTSCSGMTENFIQEEVKRFNSGNAYYNSFKNLVSSHLQSKHKIRIQRTMVLLLVLYGCESWALTLREENRLRDGGNRRLEKLHNEELHNLHFCQT